MLARANPHQPIDEYEPEGDLLVLNMGPQHPATHGVLRIKLYLDGEIVVKAVPYLGYLHRGVEKLLEKLTYVQGIPIVDKNDYAAPMTNELAICMAYEKLEGCEVPRRARYLRSIVAELQRVASHLLWLGTMCIDLGGALGGGSSIFMYAFRDRELILDVFEAITGCRFHYNFHQVGGVRHDAPAGWEAKVREACDKIETRLAEYQSVLDTDPIFRQRTHGVGFVDPQLAEELGVSGPNLRASGVAFDLRIDSPYAAYDEIQVETFTDPAGDTAARYRVRMKEMRESLRIVRELLAGLPEGRIMGRKPIAMPNAVKPPKGEAYVAVEGPRGELGMYVVSDGTPNPYRAKIRPPSYHSLSLLPYVLPGATLSDVVAILGSLDPIMGEADR